MNDFEIFCAFIGIAKRIGQVDGANLSKSGSISVDGVLSDGREIHLFVIAPKQEG